MHTLKISKHILIIPFAHLFLMQLANSYSRLIMSEIFLMTAETHLAKFYTKPTTNVLCDVAEPGNRSKTKQRYKTNHNYLRSLCPGVAKQYISKEIRCILKIN